MLVAHITRRRDGKFVTDILRAGTLVQTANNGGAGYSSRESAVDAALDYGNRRNETPRIEFFDEYVCKDEYKGEEPDAVKKMREAGIPVFRFNSLEEMLDAVDKMQEFGAQPQPQCEPKKCIDAALAKALAVVSHGETLIECMKDMKDDLENGIADIMGDRTELIKLLREVEAKRTNP